MHGKFQVLILAISLVWCAIAQAQQASPGAGSDASAGLTEIVVTAERRSTNLQQTAIAATVLSGSELQEKGINTVEDLQFSMPSVTLQNFGQGNYFTIRGIGKDVPSSAVGVGVITYRDGVATFPGYFQNEPYYDIASIEVLRGPQGTFVGQNATGGAVFITEANPNFDGVHGNVELQYGNYNDSLIRGAINLPISDTLAARVAINDEYRDSFYTITGPYTGSPGRIKESSGRVSLLWVPTDQWKVLFKTDYNYLDQGGYPADPATATNDPFHITSNAPWEALDKYSRSVLDVSYTFADDIKLRSVSGYQNGWTSQKADFDGTDLLPLTFSDRIKEEIYSEEVNLLSSDTGLMIWIAGLYYQYDNVIIPGVGGYDIGEPAGAFDITFNAKTPKETEAGFGQLSFNLPDGVQIQAGARYTESSSTNDGSLAIPELGPFGIVQQNQTERDGKLTGKLALNLTLDARNFLYSFVATGHKAGGVNSPSLTVPGLPPTFRPEDVTDFEVGWKSTAFDGHVKTQLGAYYNRYKDFQVSISEPDLPTNPLVLNVPNNTTIYGLEAQGQAVFGPLSFDLGASYLHSKLGTFYAADPRLPPTAASCALTAGPAAGSCVDLSGNQQDYAPTFTFNAGAQYVIHLSQGTLTPRMDYGHIGPQWGTLFEDRALGDRLQTRNLLNAQVAYEIATWRVTGYGTNLNNEHYISSVANGLRYAGNPRQYGLRVSKSF
jgi:iron complex outermembrane recepter protein